MRIAHGDGERARPPISSLTGAGGFRTPDLP